MARFFNTTGPSNPADHYMVSPGNRLVGGTLSRYIESKLYWVLHAPRQTGKTTFLQSWMREINSSDQALACYVSIERCQGIEDTESAMTALCEAIREYATRHFDISLVPSMPTESGNSALSSILTSWAKLVAPKPLVVLFDEVDVLAGQVMISFLRQLRGGFADRGVGMFPVSVALVGMRDLRDYLVTSKDGVALNPGSPFNIKESSVSLSNFSLEEIALLLAQHTVESGQRFSNEAIEKISYLTGGQPWLVNSLAKKCCWQLCPNGELITADHVFTAKEMLIKERAVHLDSLAERLKDPRIRRIVQTILTGESDPTLTDGDDFRLALDMGLVTKVNGTPSIANPIYNEIIPRVLTQGMQDAIPAPEFRWKNPDGSLDLDSLMEEFQMFWAQHADIWEIRSDYTEAFPHLLLMAFLQRVVNGGGQIEREYAAGRGRVDLALKFAEKWYIIEIKMLNYLGRSKVLSQGLTQIERYRDQIDPSAPAYLVIFDRTESGRKKTWEERLTRDEVVLENGRLVVVIGG